MKVVILTGLALLLASCKQGQKPQPIPEELTKLERLYRIRSDSVMKHYDLSNDSLTAFPDLSRYVIASLDLSLNQLDTIIPERLPLGIERLDMSHNHLKGSLWIRWKSMPTLEELNLSYNSLENISVDEELCRLIVPYNRLKNIEFDQSRMRFLDISFNLELSEKVKFNPARIDTVVRKGVANGKPLEFMMFSEPKIISCTFEDIFGPFLRIAKDSIPPKQPEE